MIIVTMKIWVANVKVEMKTNGVTTIIGGNVNKVIPIIGGKVLKDKCVTVIMGSEGSKNKCVTAIMGGGLLVK